MVTNSTRESMSLAPRWPDTVLPLNSFSLQTINNNSQHTNKTNGCKYVRWITFDLLISTHLGLYSTIYLQQFKQYAGLHRIQIQTMSEYLGNVYIGPMKVISQFVPCRGKMLTMATPADKYLLLRLTVPNSKIYLYTYLISK